MNLRTRIAVLIGITVLVASTIGGLGVALSSRNVGRDLIDDELRADMSVFDQDNPRLSAQVPVMLEVRRTACDETIDSETADGDTTALDRTEAADELADAASRVRPRLERFGPVITDFASSMQVVRPNGLIVPGCRALPVGDEEFAIARTGEGTLVRTVALDGTRYRVMTTGFGEIGAVQVARDLDLTEATLRGLFVRILGFGVIGALLAGLLGWRFARRSTEPIERLSAAATRVATTRDLGERIEIEGDHEVSELATSFNTMLSSLDTSREQQHRLVQDASHELRTPLTSLRTNVELLRRHHDIEPAVRDEMLTDIADELNELSELTAELVDSATEVTSDLTRMTSVDLVDVVDEAVARGRRRHRREIGLERIDGAGSIIVGDPSLITRALTNLINNAAKFCGPDDEIVVVSNGTTVLVRDGGPGIPDDDLPHVFERFYRATAARSAPGSGLGLAIVKQIVDGHGGTVHATNRATAGLEIGFTLPVAPSGAGAAAEA